MSTTNLKDWLMQILFLPLVLLLNNTKRTRVLINCEDKTMVTKGLGANRWGLPGGGLKKHETPKQGAIREVKEEVGINLDEVNLVDHGEHLFKDKLVSFTICLIETKLDARPDVKKQRHEVSDYAWLKRSELNEKNSNKELLMALTLSARGS
ncbi:MAG TPA: NUDIX hydrolase [Candidatus Saccharimonadales bacterium]